MGFSTGYAGPRIKSKTLPRRPENIFRPMFTRVWREIGINYPEKTGMSLDKPADRRTGRIFGIIRPSMPLFVPKDRKSLFRQFLAGMYDAVVITDPNGHIIEVNPRAVEHFGYEQDEVLDRHVSFYIPGLAPEVVQRIRKALEGDRHVMVDANGRCKDGTKIACEIAVSVIDLMDPGDLVFTIRNVERRREVMNAFRAKANAFHISQAALFSCDPQGNIRDANAAFLEMFNLSDAEKARQHVFADFMGDAPLPENFKRALAGETTVTGIVAEGDGDDKEELEIVLAPNMHGRKSLGVVGSIQKV